MNFTVDSVCPALQITTTVVIAPTSVSDVLQIRRPEVKERHLRNIAVSKLNLVSLCMKFKV